SSPPLQPKDQEVCFFLYSTTVTCGYCCPLILVPPKIVARFGDPVSAVCNTSATDAEGIGWEVPVQGIGPVPPPSVTWNVEKLVEWDIEPVCYLNLKDGTQCSVTLPVTLYHTPDKVSISGPDHDLIEGNEYRLKCYIHNVAPAEKLKVFWYKDDDELRVREFSEESRTPVTVSDTLSITPTRHYHESVFKCLALLDLRPDGPQNLFTVSSPYTAVVQCEFSSHPFQYSYTLSRYKHSLLYYVISVLWNMSSVWTCSPVKWMGTPRPRFSGTMRVKCSILLKNSRGMTQDNTYWRSKTSMAA
uniref:Ig-like domain-containing protein n=1 Tax=Salarias fasciatus TaxID=181472 RepID=A0A672FCS8_SALFA